MEPFNSQAPYSSTPPSTPQQQPKKENFFWEIFKFTVVALAIVLPIRLFIAQPFIVSGASMDPTFATGEYLIVDQLSYHIGNPQRGQVVIFRYPKDETKYFIKRIIGLPGEKVSIKGTEVTIINKDNPQGFKLSEPYISAANEKEDDITVDLQDGQYFVMGDNRRQSFDSRSWGILPRSDIIGTPFVRLFPLDKISLFPGDFDEPK